LLREDDVAVGDDIELGLGAFEGGRFEAAPLKLGRETRGPFVVPASDRAVEDFDGHAERIGIRWQAAPMRYSRP
jgi:hypothetical protein